MSYLTELGIHTYGDALNLLSETRRALKGFSTLLDMALFHDGGGLQHDASGIISLLDRQLEDIGELETFLRDEFRRLEGKKPAYRTMGEEVDDGPARVREIRDAFIRSQANEGTDAAAIAQALNLKKATVERVIGQLLSRAAASAENGGRTRQQGG